MASKTGWIILISLLLVALLVMGCGGAAQNGIPSPPPDAPFEFNTPEEENGIPGLTQQLSRLYLNWQTDPVQAEATAKEDGLILEEDRVLVTMVTRDTQAAENVINVLPDYDAELYSHYETWVDAWIPIPNLAKVAALPGILHIDQPDSGSPAGD